MFNRRTSVNHEFVCKAIPNLKKSGVLNNICKFPDLVSDDIFPLYNIYFLLFLDTVNLFATENASGLRYRKKTMLFWMFGLLYFHGKWIRFCRDEQFSGSVLEHKESKKYFNPQLNKPRIKLLCPLIIFKKLCRKNVSVPHSLKPRVIHSLLDPR